MARSARMPWWWMCLLLLSAGCAADNAMVLKGKLSQVEQQQAVMTRQNQQLQDKANALAKDNEDMGVLLSQARQQAKISEDKLVLIQDQLKATNSQLAQTRSEKETNDKRVQALTASLHRQGGVTIGANNSLMQTLPVVNIPGVRVGRLGDAIYVELPGDALFEPGGARLRPGADNLIANAAAEILRVYPEQIIGIEGHTSIDPVQAPYRSNHELSVVEAMVVYDVLVNRSRIPPNQLCVIGRGANQPAFSNTSPEGKQRNRRVNLVVYPDRRG
jgi:flagellar motor protein MotB